MSKILILVLSLLCMNSYADVAWIAGGAGFSSFKDVTPKKSDDLKNGTTFFVDLEGSDKLPFFLPHYGYRYSSADEVKINSTTEADFTLKQHELGPKLMLPWKWFGVWAGAGGLWGRATLDKISTGAGADKSRAVWGFYKHAGLDIFFNDHIGLRFAYQINTVDTGKFKNLNGKSYDFDYSTFMGGLCLRLF